MVAAKRKRETDAAILQEHCDNSEAKKKKDDTRHAPLGLFSALPREIVEKIVSHTSQSIKEEVILRGVCRGFRDMYCESHIKYKRRKMKKLDIFNRLKLKSFSRKT